MGHPRQILPHRRLLRNNGAMRHFHGKEADHTLTTLEREFFKGVENRVHCRSMHFWNRGVWIAAVSPLLPQDGRSLALVAWMSLS